MYNFMCCTVTGADHTADIAECIRYMQEFRFLEFALLFSEQREGSPRYPSRDLIRRFISRCYDYIESPKIALHLCGRTTIDAAFNDDNEVMNLVSMCSRVQLNFRVANHSMLLLANFLDNCTSNQVSVIIQDNDANEGLHRFLEGWPDMHTLYDVSGGNGVTPVRWPRPKSAVYGYAGGISPENVKERLDLFKVLTQNTPFWIDMESSLRDERNHFSLEKVGQVANIVAQEIFHRYEPRNL